MWHWTGKLRGRPWIRTLSGGIQQIYTRVLGTTVVAPTVPRIFHYQASNLTAVSLVARRNTTVNLPASEAQ